MRALPIIACVSRFPTVSYPEIACRKVRKGLEIGNDPKTPTPQQRRQKFDIRKNLRFKFI